MQPEKIYIALSEPIVLMDVRKILMDTGYQDITGFNSFEKMLEQTLVHQTLPDLIILESFFSKDSDAAERIRNKYEVPLIFLTSRHSDEPGNNGTLSNCIFLPKPFDERDLVNSVKKLLHTSKT